MIGIPRINYEPKNGQDVDCSQCLNPSKIENVTKERFDLWKKMGSEIIKTPSGNANIKAMYDKCAELSKDPTYVVLNQFCEMGNPIYHYNVTGPAIREVVEENKLKNNN